ncbi:MAG: DnaD domain protein [Bacilli bacterium]|nr:DnaD domain protein [Bacilli bacterium]
MKTKLEKAIGDGNIVIPLYILKYFKKLDLNMDEFVFLMYLYNKQDKIDFNPEKIARDLNIDIMEVMGYISVLSDKGYLTLDVIKENDILDEVINLSCFYEKISFLLMDQVDEHKDSNALFKYVESELGRPISATEIETIKSWISNNIDESLIKEGVKIAINDGVYSLKYIDKILFDFKNRGIKTVDEIKSAYNNVNTNSNSSNETLELDDWNWLDDEEEYITN